LKTEYDVIIVGARVAGSALACHLARRGFDVLLCDRGSFPSDILSTHNFFNNSLAMLQELGVLDELLATNTPTYNRLRIQFGGAVIDGVVPAVGGYADCLCIRRTHLDRIFFERAKSHPNVTALENFRVAELTKRGDEVSGVVGQRRGSRGNAAFAAKLVVGADGRLSTVRKLAGSARLRNVPSDFASYVAYVSGFTQDGPLHAELYRQGDKYAIAFPTSDGQYALGVMFPLTDKEWAERMKRDPEAAVRALVDEGFAATTLPRRLRAARFDAPVRGLVGYDNDWHQGMGAGWALVGDALTFKDPTVGTGLHDALFGARTLAELLASMTPNEWTGSWEAMAAAYQRTMEERLMAHFLLGCQLTKNTPIAPEQEAAYALVGADAEATRKFLGFYNYSYSWDDIEREIGKLIAAKAGTKTEGEDIVER